jgi:AraC-like DNA-binding protein
VKGKLSHFDWLKDVIKSGADTIGEDVILLDYNQSFPHPHYPVKLDVTMTLLCTKGRMSGSVNLKEFTIEAPFMLILIRGQILQYKWERDDFSCTLFFYSDKVLTNILSGPQERLPLFLSIFENPTFALSKEWLNDISNYYQLLQKAIRNNENPYRLEAVKHLTQALFYDSGYRFHRITEKPKKTRTEVLMEDFLNLVRIHYKHERETVFYAAKLKLTPKYLSGLIKENSNKSANDWINEYVVLEAKALLKSTSMNIQEISDHLHFPSQSFFGKYFRRHVGVSPKEYRIGNKS